MSSTTNTPAAPMVCPPWCAKADHGYEAGNPDDSGWTHESDLIDMWALPYNDAGIAVSVTGFRHDRRPEYDEPDQVHITGSLDPGGVTQLASPDARRLGQALIRGAALIGGTENPPSCRAPGL